MAGMHIKRHVISKFGKLKPFIIFVYSIPLIRNQFITHLLLNKNSLNGRYSMHTLLVLHHCVWIYVSMYSIPESVYNIRSLVLIDLSGNKVKLIDIVVIFCQYI